MKTLALVLLVEADLVDVQMLRVAWSKVAGTCPLIVAHDGREALARLEVAGAPRPDLMLLELNLPRMNGLELLAALRRDARWRDLPVVVLTRSVVAEDRRESLALGASDYFAKPAEPAGLVTLLRTLVQAGRLPVAAG